MEAIVIDVKNEEVYAFDEEYLRVCNTRRVWYRFISRFFVHFYLSKSVAIFASITTDKCVFSGKEIETSMMWLTDGEWIWTANLLHYSLFHNFIWPDSFIKKIRKKRFLFKKVSDEALLAISENRFVVEMAKKYHGIDLSSD